MNPHALHPLAVTPGTEITLTHKGEVEALGVEHVLAEVPGRSNEWMAGVVRRLLTASAAPVACGIRGKLADRLEAAGWFVAAEGADLEHAREACWPALPTVRRLALGYGSLRPGLVLVGERVNRAGQLAFASRSGVWLFRALRRLHWDELRCYVANACGPRGRRRTERLRKLHRALAAYEPTWVALGRVAQEVLKSARIPHVHVCHPQHHRRYHYAEDVTGYAKRLHDAGVPDAGVKGLDWHAVETLPELPGVYGIRSTAYAKGKSGPGKHKGKQATKLSAQKRERARRAFVTGEVPTLKAAAELVGVKVDRVGEVAREEGWRAERDEHHRQVTEDALEAARKEEAKRFKNARRLAWAGAEQGLADVVERLRAARGDEQALHALKNKRMLHEDDAATPLHPTPQQAEALIRGALALSQANLAPDDPERDRMAQLPPLEACRQLAKTLEEQFGQG